jgi:hypothetical protein
MKSNTSAVHVSGKQNKHVATAPVKVENTTKVISVSDLRNVSESKSSTGTAMKANTKVISVSDLRNVSESKSSTGTVMKANTKIITVLDPKETKYRIVAQWESYTAPQVVKIMRQLYPNVATASSQLSNIKSQLAALASPPPSEYLDALKLSKAEYKVLRDEYREKRDKEGFDLTVVHDADRLVTQALEMMTSSDHRILWPAAVLCSGLRPVELLTTKIKPNPETKHPHDPWWVCISSWAKKGDNVKDASKRDFCRDHPLLCPSWLWVRAIDIIRLHYNKKKLTKRELHQSFAKHWLQLLSKGFPQLVKPTHVLMRRLYAKYSFIYFQDDFPNVVGENSYISWVLGHTSVEPALSYTNLQIKNAGKIKLFEIGQALKVPAASQRSPRSTKGHSHMKQGKADKHDAPVASLVPVTNPEPRLFPNGTKK